MDRFTFEKTNISGVFVVTPKKIIDPRGYYERFFCSDEFKELGFTDSVKQINHSQTVAKGVIRGFHYQKPPYCEMKLVRCINGSIFDVALDLRKNSPTFMKHFSCELSSANGAYLLIPEGVAHAFQTTSDLSEILYIVNKKYTPSSDVAINPLDRAIGVQWPLKINTELSKELGAPMISLDFTGIDV